MSSKQTSLPNSGVPDEAIDNLLGYGLGYEDWESRLKAQGYGKLWNDHLKNTIIRREFEYFKDETLDLRAEPNEAKGGKEVPRTNSSASIMKRFQGHEWVEGRPNERAWRLQNRRLLGKDAKYAAKKRLP
jgi:hypothetical protein